MQDCYHGEEHACLVNVPLVSFTLLLVYAIKQWARILDLLFDLMTFLNNFQHTLPFNQILFFTVQQNTLRLNKKQQQHPERSKVRPIIMWSSHHFKGRLHPV